MVEGPEAGLEGREELLAWGELLERLGRVGVGPQAAGNEDPETRFRRPVVHGAGDGHHPYVVEHRLAAIGRTAGEVDLELARQALRVRVVQEMAEGRLSPGAYVEHLEGARPGEVAPGDVAHRVAARLTSGHADPSKVAQQFRYPFEGHEVELDVLAGGEVPPTPAVALGDVRERLQLLGRDRPIGRLYPHHLVAAPLALAIDAVVQPEEPELVLVELAGQVLGQHRVELGQIRLELGRDVARGDRNGHRLPFLSLMIKLVNFSFARTVARRRARPDGPGRLLHRAPAVPLAARRSARDRACARPAGILLTGEPMPERRAARHAHQLGLPRGPRAGTRTVGAHPWGTILSRCGTAVAVVTLAACGAGHATSARSTTTQPLVTEPGPVIATSTTAGVVPVPTTAGTTTTTARPRGPGLYVYTGAELGRLYGWPGFPSTVPYDNHDYIGQLRWSEAGQEATATGTLYTDSCTPLSSCAPKPSNHVRLTARGPESCSVLDYSSSSGPTPDFAPTQAEVFDTISVSVTSGPAPKLSLSFLPACSGPPGTGDWSITASLAQPPQLGGEQLEGVSCPTASFCVAVGSVGNSALVLTWDGVVWHRAAAPHAEGVLDAVSCPSATFCVAAGKAPAGNALALTFTGGAWAEAALPRASGALLAVSCSARTRCLAVGKGASESYNGRSWARAPTPDLQVGGAGLWCGKASSCLAVGSTGVARFDGRSWAHEATLGAGSSPAAHPAGVSCLPDKWCYAVGSCTGPPGQWLDRRLRRGARPVGLDLDRPAEPARLEP